MSDVLLLQAARFGDLVQTRRLIKSLAIRHKLHLACDMGLLDLARLLYPEAEIHGLYFHGSLNNEKLMHNSRIMNIFKESGFSKIYNCNFTPLTASLCRLFDNHKIIGYRPAHDSSGGVERSPWVRFTFHLSQKRALSSLNLEDYWAFFCDEPLKPDLVNPPPHAGGKGIGIVCAGRAPRRSLSIKALSAIISSLNRIYKRPRFFLLGTAEERQIAKNLIHALSGEKLELADLTGRTNWSELGERLQGLDLLITPDTGIMHYAAFLGVPVMAFFLSSAWCHETAAYGEGHYFWQSAPGCSPCLENAACAKGEKCRPIFESPEFLRLFSLFLLDPAKEPDFPSDLHLWQSGFDKAGQILKLVRGRDQWQEGRRVARNYMLSFLGLSPLMLENFSLDWIELCGKLLCPNQEWMLPPERYD